MADPENQNLTRWQLAAGEIVATLSDLAKTPPELKAYIEAHAEALRRNLPLIGVSYELAQGSNLQRVYAEGVEVLDLESKPEQALAFKKAIQQVAEKGAPIFLPPHTEPAEVLRSVSGGDVPAPHRLPIFNQTPYLQAFIPIPLNGRVMGVIHAWMQALGQEETGFAAEALGRSCAAMELYFKARQVEDVSAELTRLHAYGEFLEHLAGDLELGTVGEALVRYAHVASGAVRVSLLVAKDYRETLVRVDESELAFNYQYLAGAGVQCPEPVSMEAKAMGEVARYFLEQAVVPEEATPSTVGGAPVASVPKSLPPALLAAPAGKRPSIQLRWIKREALDDDTAEEVQHYLMLAPMNWVTYLPLVDTQQRIVAIILFEGKEASEKSAESLLKMQGLIYAGGHAVATALFWHDRRTLRWAKKWISWKDGTLDTPKKRKWAYIGAPLALLLGVMAYPMQFNIKAPAQIRPKEVIQIAAQTSGRIMAVDVHEGDFVKQDQLLMTLDTRELEFQRRRLESDFLQALAEADLAQDAGDETGMQAALYKADRAEAQINSLTYQIDHGRVMAPFDGLVLGPKNIQQKLGLVVRMGEPLIELAKPANWEVKIQLYEQDIVYLETLLSKQEYVDASLKLTADPDQKYPLLLTDPADLSHGLEARQEDYYFIAVLPLDTTPEAAALLKAGFSGRVAFHAGRYPVAYVLFRDIIRYIRVKWL